MKMKMRCPHCLRPLERLRVVGTGEATWFEADVYLLPEEAAREDLHVHSLLPYFAERAQAGETWRRRRDGLEGPYVLPHKPRCPGLKGTNG